MRSFTLGTAMGAGVRSALALLAIVFFVTAMMYGSGTISGPQYYPSVAFAGMSCTLLGAARHTYDVMKGSVCIPAQVLGAALVTIEVWWTLLTSAPPPA